MSHLELDCRITRSNRYCFKEEQEEVESTVKRLRMSLLERLLQPEALDERGLADSGV